METIYLAGYTESEKLEIAKKFLLPKTLSEHNLKTSQIKISDALIRELINSYTREAGVRQLGQLIAKITRKSIQRIMIKNSISVKITISMFEEWLGFQKFKHCEYFKSLKESTGVASGLAWTEVGGDVLEVEAVFLKGKGGLTITGQLGEVMQESVQASLSCIRSISTKIGLKEDFYSDADMHSHIPEGAIPKDGPSAGVTSVVAMVSILTGIKIDRSVAMTGEITLQGRVLPVGGLKEKILAAIRLGIKKVIVPKDNIPDIKDFEDDIKDSSIKIVYVDNIKSALEEALVSSPFKNHKVTKVITPKHSCKDKKKVPVKKK
jgi:ATP-dependent Lon protease